MTQGQVSAIEAHKRVYDPKPVERYDLKTALLKAQLCSHESCQDCTACAIADMVEDHE